MQIRNLRLLVDSTIHKKVYFSKLQDNPFANCTGTHLGAVSRTGFARGKGTAGKRPQHMCREPGTASLTGDGFGLRPETSREFSRQKRRIYLIFGVTKCKR